MTRLKPDTPKKVTPKSAQEQANEERSRVVTVKCISPQTTKDALLNFFENKRRSGGGEIEDIQYNQDEGFADITFCSPEGLSCFDSDTQHMHNCTVAYRKH